MDDAYGAPNLNANANQQGVEVKLLCGADLLESFAVPGLWDTEDVSLEFKVSLAKIILTTDYISLSGIISLTRR